MTRSLLIALAVLGCADKSSSIGSEEAIPIGESLMGDEFHGGDERRVEDPLAVTMAEPSPQTRPRSAMASTTTATGRSTRESPRPSSWTPTATLGRRCDRGLRALPGLKSELVH